MSVFIKKIEGFDLNYNSNDKQFEAVQDGKVLITAPTQEQAEKQIRKLAKEQRENKFKLPLRAIYLSSDRFYYGKITSVIIGACEAWFSYDKNQKSYYEREKLHLRSDKLYAETEYNKKIEQDIEEIQKEMQQLQNKIDNKFKQLEQSLDMKFFEMDTQ